MTALVETQILETSMRTLFAILGICIGSVVGFISGGFVGWVLLRMVDGANPLSNPDLPGGMAWLLMFVLAGVGLCVGGFRGVRLGRQLFHQWQSEAQGNLGRDAETHT